MVVTSIFESGERGGESLPVGDEGVDAVSGPGGLDGD
jgi:hypothetical protein